MKQANTFQVWVFQLYSKEPMYFDPMYQSNLAPKQIFIHFVEGKKQLSQFLTFVII